MIKNYYKGIDVTIWSIKYINLKYAIAKKPYNNKSIKT